MLDVTLKVEGSSNLSFLQKNTQGWTAGKINRTRTRALAFKTPSQSSSYCNTLSLVALCHWNLPQLGLCATVTTGKQTTISTCSLSFTSTFTHRLNTSSVFMWTRKRHPLLFGGGNLQKYKYSFSWLKD